ncbi:hypothetical protein [Roseibium sp. SCP14]|uniref:hypothetical protein n=1 Tax=Roseibium sp. SCP14 TaxID=3141375 RepID=UPI0033373ACA
MPGLTNTGSNRIFYVTSNVRIEAIALNCMFPMPESVSRALIAGWSGHDLLAVGEHVKELAELGATTPFARVVLKYSPVPD